MKYFFRLFTICISFVLIACSDDEGTQPDDNDNGGTDNTPTSLLNINTNQTYQTVSGFGGADGIFTNRSYLSDSEVEMAFGTGEGQLGLSIFRVKLPYNSNDWDVIADHASDALQYDEVKILASPWSPPPALKSNEDPVGGFLPRENFPAYAAHINDFLNYMTNQGVDIYAISPQNEPDIEVGYESCDWTSTAMRDFIVEQGGANINAKIAAPESFNFNQAYTRPLLLDENAVQNFDIVAGHIYGGGLAPFELAEEMGKEIWMTEHLYNLNTGNTGATPWRDISDEAKWNETMQMLSDIHEAMTYNWNAYIWWYTKRYYSFIGDGTEGTTSGAMLKRGYAYSHFSRFIRPGYVRVDTEFTSPRDLKITAYQGEGRTVIVIVNDTETPVPNIGLSIDGETPESIQLYKTTLQLDTQLSEVTAENDLITFSVNSNSVITIIQE